MKNGLIVDEYGTTYYYLNDERHRVDGPAEERTDGTTRWFLNGKRHREDGPAIKWADGSTFWYVHGKLHRVDGPAEERVSGDKSWFLHGELHRVDGPAKERVRGDKSWFLHGKRLLHPVEFKTMEEFFTKLNTDEEYSLHWINEFNGLIEFIKNPTDKQKRLHAIKWKL